MTITRELQRTTIKTYGTSVDEYGQLVLNEATRTADIAFKLYSQQNVSDPRYVDVEAVGLTKDTSIVPGEVITFAQGDFRVKYVVPTGRWTELMLVKLGGPTPAPAPDPEPTPEPEPEEPEEP